MFRPTYASMVESGNVYTMNPTSFERLARIEGVTGGLADKNQQRKHERKRNESGHAEPWRVKVALALTEQFAERGGAGRQPEAEEIKRGQRGDGAVQDERQERERRHHRVRQQMSEHDGAVRHAECARGVHIFEIARAQELRSHHSHQRNPCEGKHDAEQDEETGRQDCRYDQDQVEYRNSRPDFDEALEEEVGPTAEIALHGAGPDANDRRAQCQDEAEQYGNAEPVDDAGQNVAGLVVRAEPVPVADRAVRIVDALRKLLATRRPVVEP